MRFEIDTSAAKAMAGRLQVFLAENPREKLTRSSAIEAVARMLGFNNRNEMLARLEAAPALGAPPPLKDGSEILDPVGALQFLDHLRAVQKLREVLDEARTACAARLVAEGRKVLPEGDFRAAMHSEDASGDHPMIIVEDEIVADMERDQTRSQLLHAAVSTLSDEFDGTDLIRRDLASRIAYALVNESLPLAEDMWDIPADEPGAPGLDE